MARGNKITKAEHERRVAFARKCIGDLMMYEGEVKRVCAVKFGCSPRSAERYIKAAREQLRDQAGLSDDDFRAQNLAPLQKIIADPKTSARAKIAAIKVVNRMYGLNKPQKHEISGPDGGDIPTQVTVQFIKPKP